ncbi:RND multidrug efflux transporter [Gloeomargarita lithophora Alchichica-D10]|uniref:RND multidrug efflux transporter n=2 Tax=Gloeomargarita TaxID=1188227 RepID=A0A1J0ABJ9_9CYAN|nr:efflux RND transporter permease subunit [Gloeomargarita lithophora]APB33303.1 RND multidrug efflux transporter [Gloeomargarita lithophora Alchichica-D10]
MFNLATGFIKRPVLTTVCSLLIILLGGIAIPLLPLAKLPDLAPKQVQVTANFQGADAQTTADNVTTVLERQINGTEDMLYMSSYTDSTGNATISVSFPVEIDANIAQVLVQNNVATAQPQLPESVNRTGVTTNKQSPSITLAYGIYSEKNEQGEFIYDNTFLSNYVDRYITDEIKRLDGVGAVNIAGQRQYAMRIWLNPDALAARGVTAQEVVNAINQQNVQVGAGVIGQEPAPPGQQYQLSLRAVGRFTTPQEAEDIVVKTGSDGALIRIRDVGRAEVGAQNYSVTAIFNQAPAVALLVYQLPGSNAWNTGQLVRAKMDALARDFPPGLQATIALDNTDFVAAALQEAFKTLFEAILLVFLVILLFLQDWRTTIIPSIAIPVSLIGAMAFALAFGFSMNQLTLFGVILATGLVVDDGILVVEAVANKLQAGMRPLQAAIDSMGELLGAVIATSLVLVAVFIPVTFFPGTTGIVYKQFALIIIFAIIISTFNAMSFSPTMAAILMRPSQPLHGPLRGLFGGFNQGFEWVKQGYTGLVAQVIRWRWVVVPIFVVGLIASGWIYQVTPQGFIPEEDQGYFFMLGEAPSTVSLQYTTNQVKQVEELMLKNPEVSSVMGIGGFSFTGNASNKALFFVKLKPWEERQGIQKSVFGLLRWANRLMATQVTGMRVAAVNAPAIDGLGSTGGMEVYLQDRAYRGMDALIENSQKYLEQVNQRPEIASAFANFTPSAPLVQVSIDRNLANAQNVDINTVFNTMQTYLGSTYVNQYVLGGFLYRVYAQADAQYRSDPQAIDQLYVRSRDGRSVQLSQVVRLEQITYPPIVQHYNIYTAVDILANPAQGFSTGDAMRAMEEVAQEVLAPGFALEWTGMAFQERAAAGAAPIVFGLSFVIVFLVLAAQYESYIDPLIIMLTVPLSILGALGAIQLRANLLQSWSGWPAVNNNMYTQIALVMLIALASKNAILIVEFANQAHKEEGMNFTQAAIHACRERLRPILMTVLSGLVGFAPLLVAKGAGAMSRWSLGTALFGGYAISTLLSLFLVPVLYVVIKNLERQFFSDDGGETPAPTALEPTVEDLPAPVMRFEGSSSEGH